MRPATLLIGLACLTLAACGKKEEAAQVDPATLASSSGPAATPGELKFATVCSGCHGIRAQGMGVFPSLAGKSADYLSEKLTRYRSGEKIGDMSDTMMPFAQPLTDEEIAQISSYLAGLR